jgi:protease-4
MRESIFYSSLRAFFIALFGVAGLLLGIFLVMGFFGAISLGIDGAPTLNYTYSAEIQPDANDIRKEQSSSAPVILQINIHGMIGLDSLKTSDIAQLLVESRERAFEGDRVKAILLDINSPGGTVNDADGIYRQIKAYKERYKVPVYAYVDGLCASGGYYIAAAADKVYASDASVIGSVGVLLSTMLNFSKLMDKVGVDSLTLYDGKGKDNLNPLRPWKKGEEENIQQLINYYYKMFVDIVTQARPGLDKTKLIDDYGANVFSAEDAKTKGYIDSAGYSRSKSLQELAEKIGIHDDYYQVVTLENKNWVSKLFQSKNGLLTGNVNHRIELGPEASQELAGKYLYLYSP